MILLLSGVGDATELKSLDIPVVKNIPDVGKNLQDHQLLFGNHVRLYYQHFLRISTDSAFQVFGQFERHL